MSNTDATVNTMPLTADTATLSLCRNCNEEFQSESKSDQYCVLCSVSISEETKFDHYFEDNAECLLSGAAGVYLPLEFTEGFNMSDWHVDQADADILLDGPDHEHYWDTWDYVLGNAYHTDKEGRTWRLYQDDDLWAIPDVD